MTEEDYTLADAAQDYFQEVQDVEVQIAETPPELPSELPPEIST